MVVNKKNVFLASGVALIVETVLLIFGDNKPCVNDPVRTYLDQGDVIKTTIKLIGGYKAYLNLVVANKK